MAKKKEIKEVKIKKPHSKYNDSIKTRFQNSTYFKRTK